VYGGVHLSLSDYLMGLACITLGKQVTTAQINGNFVKSLPKNARIRGVSNVEHKGQSTMVTSNINFDEWASILQDERVASDIVD